MDQVVQTPEQQQYISKLLGFTYTNVYKPGKTNNAADALSRVPESTDSSFSMLMNLSKPVFKILDSLKAENVTKEDLVHIHKEVQ